MLAQTGISTEIKKSTTIEKIDGVKFYMHKVEAGQTIYSIAKAYEVNSKDIIFENPEAIDGVSVNQILKIPVKPSKAAINPPVKPKSQEATNYISHTVGKQQTLYAISKIYDISVEEISIYNPEVSAGLKEGQVLKIPQKNALGSTPKEIPIPPVETKAAPVAENKIQGANGKTYSVSLLLPFNANDIDTNKFSKNIRSAIPSKSYAAIEFYEGFLIAADSLVRNGMNIKLNVYDAPNDSLQVVRLLEKSELKKSELILGPFHNLPTVLVADYAKRNQIPNVIPFAQQNKVLLGNPYAIKVSASTGTQVEVIAKFISTNYKKQNVIVLHNALVKEKASVKLFKQEINSVAGKDSVVEVIFKTAGVKGLQAKLSATNLNVIFIPSNDQAFVTSLVNSLRGLKKDFKICLFGMESWTNFDNLDINTIQDLQLHVPVSSFVDYNGSATIAMMKSYREKFKTDPSKYALHGYDCGLYFLSALQKEGKEFYKNLPAKRQMGLQCNFQFSETAVESGFENKSVFVLEYKDFALTPAK